MEEVEKAYMEINLKMKLDVLNMIELGSLVWQMMGLNIQMDLNFILLLEICLIGMRSIQVLVRL